MAECAASRREVARSETQVPPVRGERDRRQVLGGELKTVCLKAQIPDQGRRHQVQQVGAGGDLETGGELARDGGATDALSRFEHEHAASAACEVRGAHESVVAAADDDAVVVRARRRVHWMRPRSRRMAFAELAPGAPMTPPPGCVLEPHRYMPRTGARYCA